MKERKLKLAIIGTNGIPANYGGFETLVEFLAQYLSHEFEITVYCSSKIMDSNLELYKGVKLKYIKLSANGWQSIFFDFLSLFSSYKAFDKILILGCSGSIFQPLFKSFSHKIIMNIGGLDWQRSKWNFFTRKFLKFSEKLAIKYSGTIVSDNQGIYEYILAEYDRPSVIIAYGGDQAFNVSAENSDFEKFKFLNDPYAFTVARIQPDNNIELLCSSFDSNSSFPLVIVGNWSNSKFGISIKKLYQDVPNLVLLDAIYDQRELNLLRSNCYIYLHGHSAGGTNPALVEAMNLGLPIFAYNNTFNRYTTQNKARYFSDSISLKRILNDTKLDELEQISIDMLNIAKLEYKWSTISSGYSAIINFSTVL